MKIYIDEDLPKSCAECPFLVHCDECESWENLCPILRSGIGYDCNEPYTPNDHRREDCPLKEVGTVERQHGEWTPVKKNNSFDLEVACYECSVCKKSAIPKMQILIFEKLNYCPNCGAKMGGDEE